VASIRDMGQLLTPARRILQKVICRFADCVLVNAEAIRQTLIDQGYDAEKILIIRNGIMLTRFASHNGNGSSNGSGNGNGTGHGNGYHFKATLGLPPSARLVGVFSRLIPLKGIEYFLDSAGLVAQKFPDAYFMIVGDGSIRPQLEAQAQRLGINRRVIFTGFRSDVPEFLPEVTVSVLPSLSEGLSNSLLESLAAAIPVVATRVGGTPEIVKDEVNGLLVPPRDPRAMAAAISRVLENPGLGRQFGKTGQQQVNDLFSLDRTVQETEHLYSRLAEARGFV
jgi:glycosyltransferase involved in cell wall biosynthesis